jgi:PAS domain S-box-containing protein
MTIATPSSDGLIGIDVPERQQAGLCATIRPLPRLTALRRLALLDTPAEQAFDRLTRLAAKILRAPVALLSLVDGDRSFFKSSVGLPELWASLREMPLSHSVCQHVVAMNAPLVINDARADPLVSDNQAVAELRIVAYLGIPLVTSEGHALGTFAVIDTVPRLWTPDDVTTLSDLASSAMTEIELRAETNQRQLVEQRLHLMESVVGNAAAAVLIAEANSTELSDLRIVFVNDAYTRLTGYSRDEVVGRIHEVLNSSDTDRSQIDTIRTALSSWKPARLEFLTRRKNGSAFWAESNIVPIADESGRYSHWVIIQRDISVRMAAEEALREIEERFRVLTEAIPQIVWTARPDGSLDYFNQRWFDYTGLTLEQTQGWGWERVLHPDDLKACVDRWTQAVKTGEIYEIKYRFKRAADGTYRWHLGQAQPVRDAGGNIVKWFGTCTDITELKEGERRLAAQYACTRIIADSAVMDETIPKILQAVCENLGWTLGQMWQMDPKAGLLRCVAVWHEPAAAVAAFADLSRKTTFRPGLGLPGCVWIRRGADWVSNVASDVNFPRVEEATRCGLHGAFAFPILQGDAVLGVMEFFHESIPEPDAPLLALVAAVGSQVGQFMERMRTEEARRCSEERYRSLVLTGSQIVWITDGAGQLLLEDSSDWSTWLTFTGQTAEQAQGRGWLDAIHPDDRARTAEGWALALARKSFYQVEYRMRTATGEYRHTVARGVPVMDANGRVREWVGSNTDITEQKLAEEALRRSDERFRWYFDLALTGMSITTPTKGFLEVNDEICRILGYTRAELLEKTWAEMTYPDDLAADVAQFDRVLAGESDGYVLDKCFVRKDGRVIDTTISVRCMRGAEGEVDYFVGLLQDVTEQKRAAVTLQGAKQELEVRVAQRTSELSEANEFLKALLENVQDGIVACDSKGDLSLLNRAIRKFHGLAELPNHDNHLDHQLDLYHSDGLTPMTTDEIPLNRAFRGERIQNVEIVIAPNGAEARTLLASGRAFYDGQGNKLGAVVSLNDITERKRAEMELQKAHEELERRVEKRTAELALAKEAAEAANRAKSEFFSRMSHELRTPLNVILGFGQLLELDALSDPQRESAEQIGKGGRHLLTLVNEVLDIARIEAGGAGMLSGEEVDIGEVVREVLEMIQPLANQAGVRLLPPQRGSCEGAVHADLQRIKQVLLNLLSNGIKYNRKGGTVAICCAETTGTMLRISVTDTGPGIASEKMHRLFVPFDRLDAEKTGVEGTGLGLTLARGLVEAMQGKMGVESTVGKGSTFWVELPRIDKTGTPVGENPVTVADAEETPITSGTVLCVEDNPANFRLIERILKLRPGVRLLSAAQGRLGIDLARQYLPDLIFLDLHLPDIQGDEVLRQLRADGATHDIPVVMLSADATPRQVERLLAAGANRYLLKPLDVKEFLRILDETLRETSSA